MFRCKFVAFRVSDFYIGLLEHFKKSKSLRRFLQKVEVNLVTLTIKIFNHFIKKHLIKFKHVNLFQNF